MARYFKYRFQILVQIALVFINCEPSGDLFSKCWILTIIYLYIIFQYLWQTDIFAKNMSFKSKFQIISNIAFKFRYIGLHQSVNHVGDLFSRCWILLRRKNRVIGVLYMFTEIFLKRRTHKEPVIIYVEVGVGGGGEEGGGGQGYFRLARGG